MSLLSFSSAPAIMKECIQISIKLMRCGVDAGTVPALLDPPLSLPGATMEYFRELLHSTNRYHRVSVLT